MSDNTRDPQCQTCGAPTADAWLCIADTERLTKILAEMPAWLHELEVTAARQAKTTSGNSGKPTKKDAQPLPYDVAAAELLSMATRGLLSTVDHIASTRGLTARTVTTAADAARWLVGAVDSIRLDELAGDIHAKMRDLRSEIRRAIDNTGKRWAGPCTAIVQSREIDVSIDGGDVSVVVGEPIGPTRVCGADLRTRPGAPKITCPECGTTYDPIERARWIVAQSAEHMGTAAFIGAALADAGHGSSARQLSALIRKWAERDRLFAWREDDLGRPLYRVGDVLDLLTEGRDTRKTA